MSVVVETSDVFGSEAREFLHELGSRMARISLEPKSFQYMVQGISVAVLYNEAMQWQCWEQLLRTLVWMFYFCTSDSNNDNGNLLLFTFLSCYWICCFV